MFRNSVKYPDFLFHSRSSTNTTNTKVTRLQLTNTRGHNIEHVFTFPKALLGGSTTPPFWPWPKVNPGQSWLEVGHHCASRFGDLVFDPLKHELLGLGQAETSNLKARIFDWTNALFLFFWLFILGLTKRPCFFLGFLSKSKKMVRCLQTKKAKTKGAGLYRRCIKTMFSSWGGTVREAHGHHEPTGAQR